MPALWGLVAGVSEHLADAFDAFLIALYQGSAGNSLSPNFYPWLREKRIRRLQDEIRARVDDWRNNAKALKRFGLLTSPEMEIRQMLAMEKKLNALDGVKAKLVDLSD